MIEENHQLRIIFSLNKISEIANKGQQTTLYKINEEVEVKYWLHKILLIGNYYLSCWRFSLQSTIQDSRD